MNPKFWDERYGTDEFAYGREPNDFLRDEAHRIPKGRVLCVADGEGRNSVFLAGLGYDVTAVDFSREGVRKIARLAGERNVAVTAVHDDLARYEPELDAFSGVVSIFAHLAPAIRKRVHGWVPRALRSGGVFLLEAYTPAQLELNTGGPKDPTMLMTLEGLRAELAPLELDLGREVRREIHEGPFHGGPSATVQVAARRT